MVSLTRGGGDWGIVWAASVDAAPTTELHPAQDSELRRASLHQMCVFVGFSLAFLAVTVR